MTKQAPRDSFDLPCVMRLFGSGEAVPGAHIKLALSGANAGRAFGLTLKKMDRSRTNRGVSFYLNFLDRKGRLWFIRISDHYRPERAQIPNVELISRCGTIGDIWLEKVLADIARGALPWANSAGTYSPPPAADQRRITAARKSGATVNARGKKYKS